MSSRAKPSQAKSVLFALASCCLWPVRVARARRDLELLAGLDDRGLADIGLSRQDLRDVTALGLSQDPTGPLSARARERASLAMAAREPANRVESRVSGRAGDRPPEPSSRARIA